MKKIFLPLLSIVFVTIVVINMSSCKQDISDRFEYQASQDTIPPSIDISVPAPNQTYSYGNHVAIVGTISDLESAKNDIHDPGFRKGELRSVSITVEDLTNSKKLLVRNPVVANMDGIGFNERVEIISGTGTTDCRLIIVATDASEKGYTVRDTVNFTYQ